MLLDRLCSHFYYTWYRDEVIEFVELIIRVFNYLAYSHHPCQWTCLVTLPTARATDNYTGQKWMHHVVCATRYQSDITQISAPTQNNLVRHVYALTMFRVLVTSSAIDAIAHWRESSRYKRSCFMAYCHI